MEYTGPERRSHIRVGVLLELSYTLVDADQEHKELAARDISGGGMRIPVREKLAIGALLKVQLELLKEKKRIQLEAKVVWIKSTSDDKEYPYEAGIEFINIDFAERTMISNCVQYLNRAELLKEFPR